MARPITFVGTLSIFEPLIFNQIDLYCENIITQVLHIDLTLLWYYFLRDRNKNHVTMTNSHAAGYIYRAWGPFLESPDN